MVLICVALYVVYSFVAVHAFHVKLQFLMTLQHLCCLFEVPECMTCISFTVTMNSVRIEK